MSDADRIDTIRQRTRHIALDMPDAAHGDMVFLLATLDSRDRALEEAAWSRTASTRRTVATGPSRTGRRLGRNSETAGRRG